MTKIILKIILKVFGVVFSAAAGIIAAIIIVSPFIWYANAIANDGPIFPPPLVALGFFGLPFAVLLLPWQLMAALYELISKKTLGLVLLVIAAVGGLLAGSLWYLVMKSSQTDSLFLLALWGTALIQSYVVFGCYWLANKSTPILFETGIKMWLNLAKQAERRQAGLVE